MPQSLPQLQQVLNKMFHVKYMAKIHVVKSTHHPCKGPRFTSQHPYGGSQLSSSRGFHVASWLIGFYIHIQHIKLHKHIHINIKQRFSFKDTRTWDHEWMVVFRGCPQRCREGCHTLEAINSCLIGIKAHLAEEKSCVVLETCQLQMLMVLRI